MRCATLPRARGGSSIEDESERVNMPFARVCMKMCVCVWIKTEKAARTNARSYRRVVICQLDCVDNVRLYACAHGKSENDICVSEKMMCVC